jgi:lysylphosphatidylglycerol synthetase-like protein (DUF2156 family)
VTSTEKHQRETRRQVWLPLLLAVVLIVVCAVVVVVLFVPRLEGENQVSIVSNILLMVFILCPAVLCFGALAIGMVVAAFAMNKGHDALAKPLRRVEELSQSLEARTLQTTTALNRKTIELGSRFAIVSRWLGVFERPKDQKQDK